MNAPLFRAVPIAASLTIGLAVAASAPSMAQGVSFAGETVQIDVGFGPGSSNDLDARHIVPFLERHLPGKPTVIVNNMPGAAALKMGNLFYAKAKPDGKTIGMFGVVIGSALRGDAKVKFDIEKMPVIGSYGAAQVWVFDKRTGIKTPDDFVHYKGKLFTATSSRNSGGSIWFEELGRLLGLNVTMVAGYRGTGKMLQAMRSGDVNNHLLIWNRYVPNRDTLEKEGIHAVFERGRLQSNGEVASDPLLKSMGLVTAQDIIRKYKPEAVGGPIWKTLSALMSTQAVNRPFFLPPGTPENIATVWRTAFEETFSDPDFIAATKKTQGVDLPWVDYRETRALMRSARKLYEDPDVKAVLARHIKTK